MLNLKDYIVDVPNFPLNGVVFKDITVLTENAEAFKQAVDEMASFYKGKGITKVAGIESRGFFFAPAVAYALGAGFAAIRKKGKLPRETVSESYTCEYSSNTIEVHKGVFSPSDKVVLIDDVLATGGTAKAACELIKKNGAELVGISFLLELTFLKGREKLLGTEVKSLIQY
ncbi:adenine phosphoribosyltransferase [Parelusimicrobium proximum]|uniref:adenine phosphoribosyltransferase n=1 Tax=Parelusimicrobium proximum TaxID=3228953 RepID=UPI003D178E08